jgi:hypothetical protein
MAMYKDAYGKPYEIVVTKTRDGYVVSKKKEGRITRQSSALGKEAAAKLAKGWQE